MLMSTVKKDTQDHLIVGQTGNIGSLEFPQGTVCKVYVMFFDEKAGLKAIR